VKFSLVLLAFLALPACADEVADLRKIIDDAVTTTIQLEKEAKSIRDDQRQKKESLAGEVTMVTTQVKIPIEKKLQELADEYAKRCHRSFSRLSETEMSQYNECLAQKAKIEKEQDEAKVWWVEFSDDWNKTYTAPVHLTLEQQNARLAEIEKEIQAAYKRLANAKEKLKI